MDAVNRVPYIGSKMYLYYWLLLMIVGLNFDQLLELWLGCLVNTSGNFTLSHFSAYVTILILLEVCAVIY